MTTIKQNMQAVRYQPSGPGTVWDVFKLGRSAATGKTNPGSGRTITYITDRFGRPVAGYSSDDPPSGQPGFTLNFYEEAEVSYLEKQRSLGCDLFFQIATVECGTLDNVNMWDVIDHYGRGRVGDITPGDGPVTPYAGAAAEAAGALQFEYVFRVAKVSLEAINSGIGNVQLNDIAVLDDAICSDCGNGYPGADKIMYIAPNAVASATADVYYSTNGGGTWAAMSADPFSTIDEHIGDIEWDWVDTNKFRLIVGCATTDVGALAKIAYTDVTLGAEATASWTEVVSASANGANGEVVSALSWVKYGRLYIATDAGEIYLSEDQGESWDAAALYTGSNQINAFGHNFDKSHVWAVGASNTILREVNGSGTFAARVGPSGGGAFNSVAVASDGVVFAGNGTSIYKSTNEAENTGGWTQLKDFGANHAVVAIGFRGVEKSRGGDPQCVWAVVSDETANEGDLWESLDGGATWREISNLTNAGYNAAWFSPSDDNKVVIVGDASGSVGVVHQAVP